MTRVLVTGATGFIGGHIVRALLARGYAVRALVRSQATGLTSEGARLATERDSLTTAPGDVRDRRSMDAAVAGCEAVVHAAGLYTFWQRRQADYWDVNVEGTRNVLGAAAGAGVRRIVYTSTVSTLRWPDEALSDANRQPETRHGRLPDESSSARPADLAGPYKRSKWEAERIARRMAAQGAPIVIVNPTAPVGPEDRRPTPTGQLIVDFLRGAMPAYVHTGLNFVDVRDVAVGHVLALERGEPGERYLLGNVHGNLTLHEVLRMLAGITSTRPPRIRVPYPAALAAAYADAWLEGTLLRRQPRIPLEGTRMARAPMWADCGRAVRELGMPQSPVAKALADAVDWFTANGYVTGRSSTGPA